jgi:O-antigen ligase
VVAGLSERPTAAELSRGAQAGRLTTVSSNRYEYWRIGLAAFERHPLEGLGVAGFRVEWLRERSIPEAVRDTHSLEVEVAAELGLPGLVFLGMMIGGVALAARRALHVDAARAAGPAAAVLAWFLHASIDWDWQLPAVTLPAIVLAGALIVLADSPSAAPGVERVEPALGRQRATGRAR